MLLICNKIARVAKEHTRALWEAIRIYEGGNRKAMLKVAAVGT